jgi:hypothetical protein
MKGQNLKWTVVRYQHFLNFIFNGYYTTVTQLIPFITSRVATVSSFLYRREVKHGEGRTALIP